MKKKINFLSICGCGLFAIASIAWASLIGDTVQWRVENCCQQTIYTDAAEVVAGESEFFYSGGIWSVGSDVEANTIFVTLQGSGFTALTIKPFWEDLDWPGDPDGLLNNATMTLVSSSGVKNGLETVEFGDDWVSANFLIDVDSGGFTAVYRIDLDTGPAIVDADLDGVADDQDNCVEIANTDQRDTNGDGFGNFCDPDLNNDCTVDFRDLVILTGVFFSADPDADLDGDGTVSFPDVELFKAAFFGPPGPSGLPNACE